MADTAPILATGRRKTSVAQVRFFQPGEGKITINGKTLDDFFGGLDRHKNSVLAPLKLAEYEGKCDLSIKTTGGGVTGQAEAIRHGVARALAQLDEKIRRAMRREGFMTRDDRMVERKKPGRPKARRRFQYSKR
jgi:small subunit ribosomal protein S9